MKKRIKIVISLFLIMSLCTTMCYARVGGGGSSGGGSSSGGSSSSSSSSSGSHSHAQSNSNSNPIVTIFQYIMFSIVAGFSAIVFRFRLKKAKRNSKKLMDLLDDKDAMWKYKKIQKQVETAYYKIQKAWGDQDMTQAKDWIEEEYYQTLQTKIEWMKIRNQKNVLKKISLLEAIPVSVQDDPDNTKDCVWYYIRGSMIDYTVDTTTNLIVEGKNAKTIFVEYWKFVRDEEAARWKLAQILQADEKDKIVFQEEIPKK